MSSTSKVTTLFNLKDEYLKAKTDKKSSEPALGKRKKLKEIIHYKKEEKDKKSLAKAEKERKRAERLALTEREANDLARSRSVLEAKSAVYDKLSRSVDTEVSASVLVDFSQKAPPEETEGAAISFDYNASATSARGNYDDQVEEDLGPDEVHFSNVDHGEVRSKGVGFYSFSDDPLTRQQQMDFLNSMRESTERSRELFLKEKNKRRQEKLDRLNRLREKLNMGPPLERLPGEREQDEEQSPAPTLEENTIMPTAKTEDITRTIEEKFLKREQTLWEKKVEELRSEREMSFAPTYTADQRREAEQWEEEEEIDETADEIVNFISYVRRNT